MAEVPGPVSGRVHSVGSGAGVELADSGTGGSGVTGDSTTPGSDTPAYLLAIILCRRQLYPPTEPSTGSTRDSRSRVAPVATSPVRAQLGEGGLSSDPSHHRPVSDSAIGAGSQSNRVTIGKARRRTTRVRRDRHHAGVRTRSRVTTRKPTSIGLGGLSDQAGKFGTQGAQIAEDLAPLLAVVVASCIAALLLWRYTQRRAWQRRVRELRDRTE